MTTEAKLRRLDGEIEFPASACLIDCPQDVLLQEEQGDGATRQTRFRMLANSGKPIGGHPFFGTLGVRLSGIKWSKGKIPALLDHDTARRIGFTKKLSITERGLEAEGVLLDNEEAKAVAMDSRSGFPWQASVYLHATKVLEVAEGEEHEVNGYKFTGPGFVFEESELREVTFTVFGADPNTSAAALSSAFAATVRAPLKSETKMTETKQQTPAPEPVDEAKLRAEAAGAERQRVTAIMAAAGEGQHELAMQLVTEGASLQDAVLKLNADLRAKLKAKIEQAEGTKPLGSGAKNEPTPEQKLAAMPEGEAKWTAQWEQDAALRDEFMGNKAAWFSFRKNEHRCRDYGSAAAFAAANETK